MKQSSSAPGTLSTSAAAYASDTCIEMPPGTLFGVELPPRPPAATVEHAVPVAACGNTPPFCQSACPELPHNREPSTRKERPGERRTQSACTSAKTPIWLSRWIRMTSYSRSSVY